MAEIPYSSDRSKPVASNPVVEASAVPASATGGLPAPLPIPAGTVPAPALAPVAAAPQAPSSARAAPIGGASQPEASPAAGASVFSESVQQTVDMAKQPPRQITAEERAEIPVSVCKVFARAPACKRLSLSSSQPLAG